MSLWIYLMMLRGCLLPLVASICCIRCTAVAELISEFYATFEFDLPNDFFIATLNIIRLWLLGWGFKQSITNFNVTLGFIDKVYVAFREYQRVLVIIFSHFSLLIRVYWYGVCEVYRVCRECLWLCSAIFLFSYWNLVGYLCWS